MKPKILLISAFFISYLAACAQSDGAKQIATYLNDKPIAIYPHAQDNNVTYNATLDMEVSNVGRAAEHIKDIAFEQGGFLVSMQSWYREGEKHTTIVIAVPAYRFDRTREEVLQLGILMGEWISSELISLGGDIGDSFAYITIYLHPKKAFTPNFSIPKWRPVRTFEKAWRVFTLIFGFIFDILIWFTVVAGPFILIGFISVKIYRLRHKKTISKNKQGSE